MKTHVKKLLEQTFDMNKSEIKIKLTEKFEDLSIEQLRSITKELIEENIKMRAKADWFDNMSKELTERGIEPPKL